MNAAKNYVFILFIACWSLFFLQFHWHTINDTQSISREKVPLHRIRFPKQWSSKDQLKAYDELCHSDIRLRFSRVANGTKSSANCFGKCAVPNATVTFLSHGIKAPILKSLCFLNPFHGFYDCIWPLIHYLRMCGRNNIAGEENRIIYLDENQSPIRKQSWVFVARSAYMRYWEAESGMSVRPISDECVCFQSLVSFEKKALWRPVRFNFQMNSMNTDVEMPHPVTIRKDALRSFRQAIVSHDRIFENPPSKTGYVLVYGREDAPRRRWKNVEEFTSLLEKAGVSVVYLRKMPPDYWSQVRLHYHASMLIAGHGASLANTLVMKRGSAVVEIANKNCFIGQNRKHNVNLHNVTSVEDPNAWTPWHTEPLGIYYWPAPCWTYPEDTREDFWTDNDELLKLTMFAKTYVGN